MEWSLAQVMTAALLALAAAAALLGMFFFATTRAALLGRLWRQGELSARSRVYPVYTDPTLIRIVDHQPLISGILLGQYGRLVDRIVAGMAEQDLKGRTVLVTACAFGNVVPRLAAAAAAGGAAKLQVVDLYQSELERMRRKLKDLPPSTQLDMVQADACASGLPDASCDVNLLYFLLHELPPAQQRVALDEACRVLRPGGRLYVGEFHRPHSRLLRMTGWVYFHVFEPWGLDVWNGGDPGDALARQPGMRVIAKHRVFGGNYQVVVAEKLPPA